MTSCDKFRLNWRLSNVKQVHRLSVNSEYYDDQRQNAQQRPTSNKLDLDFLTPISPSQSIQDRWKGDGGQTFEWRCVSCVSDATG